MRGVAKVSSEHALPKSAPRHTDGRPRALPLATDQRLVTAPGGGVHMGQQLCVWGVVAR